MINLNQLHYDDIAYAQQVNDIVNNCRWSMSVSDSADLEFDGFTDVMAVELLVWPKGEFSPEVHTIDLPPSLVNLGVNGVYEL